jgi:uncharacterized protein (DUF1330 family)
MEYRPLVPASFQKHPGKFRGIHGRHEVLEAPQSKKLSSSNSPTFADATAWYHGPEYQAAREHRFQGGDYRCIITRGLPT